MKLSRYNIFIPLKNPKEFLLFNTLTGNTFVADEAIKKAIEEQNIAYLPEEVKADYIEKRVIIEDHIDELKYFDYFHNKTKFSHDTLSMTILLTWACNLACVYCYEGAGEVRNTSMSDETAEGTIAFIKSQALSRNVRNISITLFGGEPLVNFNVGKRILREVKEFCGETGRKLTTNIITNGTLITDEIIEELKQYDLRTMQITLDGPREVHDSRRMYKNHRGTFDEIIAVLKKLSAREDFIKPLIRINIDKANLQDAYVLLNQLKEMELTGCRLDFGIVRSGTEACASYSQNCLDEAEVGDVLDDLWKAAQHVGFHLYLQPFRKWIFCGLNGDYAFTVAPTGDLYKCWEQVGEEEHIIGRLEREGKILDLQFAYYDWMARNPINIEECRECIYLPACGGGCGAVSYTASNTYHEKGCFKVKGVIEKQLLSYFERKYPELFEAVS